jgi:hypothetical protein
MAYDPSSHITIYPIFIPLDLSPGHRSVSSVIFASASCFLDELCLGLFASNFLLYLYTSFSSSLLLGFVAADIFLYISWNARLPVLRF